jgi:malate synthase
MDPELIAYLDKHFRETSQQIEGVRQETTEQIDARFHEVLRQIEGLRQETTEQIRHTRVEIESLRDDIRLVADGVTGVREKLESFQVEVVRELKSLDHRVLRLEARSEFEG